MYSEHAARIYRVFHVPCHNLSHYNIDFISFFCYNVKMRTKEALSPEHGQTLEELTAQLSMLAGVVPEHEEVCADGIKDLGREIKKNHNTISIYKKNSRTSNSLSDVYEELISHSEDLIIARTDMRQGSARIKLEAVPHLFEHMQHPFSYVGIAAMTKILAAGADPDKWVERAEECHLPEQKNYANEQNLIEHFKVGGLRHAVNLRRNPFYLQEKAQKQIDSITNSSEENPIDSLLPSLVIAGNLATYQSEQTLLLSLMKHMSPRQISHVQKLEENVYSQLVDNHGNASLDTFVTFGQKTRSLGNLLQNMRASIIEPGSPQDNFLGAIQVLYDETATAAMMVAGSKDAHVQKTDVSESETPEAAAQREEKERVRDAREAQKEALKAAQNSLDQAIHEFMARLGVRESEWVNMSTKELKSLGLSDLQFKLITGVNDEDGNNLLAGRPKNEAKDTIAFLLYLQRSGAKTLAEELEEEHKAATELANKEPNIEDLNLTEYRKVLNDAHPLSKKLEGLKLEWPILRNVIAGSWTKGSELVAAIDPLLFPAENETEEPELEQIIEDNVEPEIENTTVTDINERDVAAIAEQLDQLILPLIPLKTISVQKLSVSKPLLTNITRKSTGTAC